jgi:hypothetical protein
MTDSPENNEPLKKRKIFTGAIYEWLWLLLTVVLVAAMVVIFVTRP